MKLNKQRVQVGHFKAQGMHSGSDVTYPDMMRINHFGLGNKQPRQLITLLRVQNRTLSDPRFSTLMKLWGDSKYTLADNKKLREGFGVV